MSLFERIENLWLKNGGGTEFKSFVEDYMAVNFNTACLTDEYYVKDGKVEFVGNYALMYTLDLENRKIELRMEGCWNGN